MEALFICIALLFYIESSFLLAIWHYMKTNSTGQAGIIVDQKYALLH